MQNVGLKYQLIYPYCVTYGRECCQMPVVYSGPHAIKLYSAMNQMAKVLVRNSVNNHLVEYTMYLG